jgi:ABC-type antimicrobial peptide transport system permease subunit
VAIVLGLVADVRDDLGELFDLESQGARPATLRRHLRLRALAVAGFGLAGGLATGAVLSALAVRFVVLTASGSSPAPPLRLAIGWPLVALALALFTAFGAVLVAAITRHAFHAQTAGRYTEVGT